MTSALVFGLLLLLLLTGTPVSIALGLTVLTALFTLTAVPLAATVQIVIQELTKARREKVAAAAPQ